MRVRNDRFAAAIWTWCLVFLSLLLWTHSVGAGHIRMDIAVEAVVRNDRLKVTVTCANRGDEAARHVQGEIIAAGRRILGEVRGTMPVGDTYRTVATFSLANIGKGTYPVVVMVHYGDTNDRPFSALAVRTYDVGTTSPPALVGTAEPLKMGGKGRLEAVLTNLSKRVVRGRIALVLPRELQAVPAEDTFFVPARQRRDVSFVVQNLAALAGSTYPVYMIAQYDEDDRHFTTVIPTTVHIGEEDSPLGTPGRYGLFVALMVLIVLFIAAQFTRRGAKG